MASSAAIYLQPAPFSPQAQICADCGVRRFSLFGALDDAALDEIHIHISDMRLEAGTTLFSAESLGTSVYTVRSGLLRLERMSDGGERRILRLVGRSDLLGLEALLGQTYAADAVACTAVEVCRIPRALVDQLMHDHAELTHDLMKRWQRALDDADEWLTELTRGGARHRMLRLLLKLSEYGDANGRIWLPTRQDMGAMLDMTFETASRLVSAFKREGLLTTLDARHAQICMGTLMQTLKHEPQ